MKPVTAELMPIGAVPVADQKLFIDWMWEQKDRVKFDAMPLTYPRATMLKAKHGDETIAMVPMHPVLMLEAMASEQNMDRRYRAKGLWEIGKTVERAMQDTGMRDAYCLINDEGEYRAVSKRGWTKVLYDPECHTWLMRRRLDEGV